MLRRWLFRWSATLPCRRIDVEGKRYLERYYLGQVGIWTFYLHRFVKEEDERSVHDHPWSWAFALILCGGYQEERVKHVDPERGWSSGYRNMFPGRLNIIRPYHFHRIKAPQEDTWTLFGHTAKMKEWGFLEKIAPKGILYTSHRPSGQHICWWEKAPLGKDIGRMPFSTPITAPDTDG